MLITRSLSFVKSYKTRAKTKYSHNISRMPFPISCHYQEFLIEDCLRLVERPCQYWLNFPPASSCRGSWSPWCPRPPARHSRPRHRGCSRGSRTPGSGSSAGSPPPAGARSGSPAGQTNTDRSRSDGKNIVKLRQGSGKDWQGMAVKAKGVKA